MRVVSFVMFASWRFEPGHPAPSPPRPRCGSKASGVLEAFGAPFSLALRPTRHCSRAERSPVFLAVVRQLLSRASGYSGRIARDLGAADGSLPRRALRAFLRKIGSSMRKVLRNYRGNNASRLRGRRLRRRGWICRLSLRASRFLVRAQNDPSLRPRALASVRGSARQRLPDFRG